MTKGSRHKLSESFIAAFYEDFVAHGAEAIETMRLRNPGEYVRAVVAILPKQTEEIANPFDGVTSDELDELDELLAAVRGLIESEGEADPTPHSSALGQPRPRLPELGGRAFQPYAPRRDRPPSP
jgi:hypothetical protein